MKRRHEKGVTRGTFLKLAGAAGVTLLTKPAFGAASDETIREREIPADGAMLPVVGLGTVRQFDVPSDSARLPQLKEVLQRFFDGGGSVIDSSPMYGDAEERVGDLLAEMNARDRAFLATKVWTRGREAGIAQMERSFERFRVEKMKLMQVHNLVDLRTHLETLRDWKAEGRIRYLGVTHYTSSALDELAGIIEREDIDFVQLAYSIGVRDAAERVLPLARDRGVAVLVNRPYEDGRVFDRVRGREVPDWARPFAASWGQFLLKFILAEPAATCVIPGTSNPEHMDDNLAAGRGPMPDADQLQRMVRFWEEL